ncbi:pyrrolysine--tRNA(Pyl) ligase large subunit [Hornefia butyriciproducens]|uniref:pyrrolysine--tRNA(Pyl) ligase large subunit n=1 Tax=Hornefia butyriciproducens TaxID=2652293 RepID=UPI0023F03078|nr:pyrrolysine--tRNA(Pyl) ligase large subunit [Hornefia butyriciproducens]MDD6299810.1 pyrrolysine--tRNA(Pyl) ligase large subunit [Hornefia butyriciproducens]
MEKLTITQQKRITELNGDIMLLKKEFETKEERDKFFREAEKELVQKSRNNLKQLLNEKHVPTTVSSGRILEEWLTSEGFTKVITPTMISREMLAGMTIDQEHKLFDQVFWLDQKKCLRPMLAPNLYVVMRELRRITNEAVKIYEIGSCFRKESQGAQHLNEFTMLNCVELAEIEEGGQLEELKRLAKKSMEVLEIPKSRYELVIEKSTVYGHTMDIEVNGLEVASGSYGPHALDANWGIFDTWVGFGFGIERLIMAMSGSRTIKRFGKSIIFLDGEPLNI